MPKLPHKVHVHMERYSEPDGAGIATLVFEDEERQRRWELYLTSDEVGRLRDDINDILYGAV